MEVHGWFGENKNELKERKKERLSLLGPVNNHWREEKKPFFLHNTKVQSSLMVVSWKIENCEKKCVKREFQHKSAF